MDSIPGWKPLIICGDTVNNLCQFKDFITLANNFIHDLVLLALFITTIVFIVVGFKLIMAGFTGDAKALNDAKRSFVSVLKGFAWIISAWVIVYTILHGLVASRYWLLG